MFTRLHDTFDSTPAWVKASLDIAAGATGVGALLGVLTSVFGLIAAFGSAVYIWLRIKWAVEDRRKAK